MSEQQVQRDPNGKLLIWLDNFTALVPYEVAVEIRRVLDRVKELEQQRDAALKLADKWEADERYSSVLPRHALSDCARELRAIFAQKE